MAMPALAVIKNRVNKYTKWYHQMEVVPGVKIPGNRDCELMLSHLNLPKSFKNKRVLDIGASDGFFSFEAERRGAKEIVAVDYAPFSKSGFKILSEIYNSKVQHFKDNVYHLSRQKYGTFDIIFFFGVLYHLPDPFKGINIVKNLCANGGTIFLETLVWDQQTTSKIPEMNFLPSNSFCHDYTDYWAPNVACVEAMLTENDLKIDYKYIEGDRAIFRCQVGNDKNKESLLQLAYK